MKINQSLLSKVGWGITGLGICNVIKDYFNRYEMRDEVLEYAKPEDIQKIYEFFDVVVLYYAAMWFVIIATGILIACILYKNMSLYSGICAGIATLCCKALGPLSLHFIQRCEGRYGFETVFPVILISSICCISTVILIGSIVFIYKKTTE